MAKTIVKKLFQLGGIDLKRYDEALAAYRSLYQKYRDFTMVPEEAFVANLELCKRNEGIRGAFVECGVWRGGMAAAMAEVVDRHRTIHLFDSFEGLPEVKAIDGKEAAEWQNNKTSPGYFNNCTADESFVKNAMAMAGQTNYKIYKGWFVDTLKTYDKGPIAILRIDADWYESIMQCLTELFPFVSENGIVIIDDYYTWDGCAKAVHEYLTQIQSPSRIFQLNNQVAFIIKKN